MRFSSEFESREIFFSCWGAWDLQIFASDSDGYVTSPDSCFSVASKAESALCSVTAMVLSLYSDRSLTSLDPVSWFYDQILFIRPWFLL